MGTTADRASYRNCGDMWQRLVSAYLARRHLTRCGSGVVIKHNAEFWLTDNAVLEVGNDCTIQNYAFFQLTKPNPRVIIGDNTVIGRHCMITAKNLIRLGNNVLMGAGAKILSNVHIGNGAVIGANAVVTHDIPANAIAAGVPARVIRYRE
jgi:acetyltransferase-like isoleucine patch superfamily enzyme